MTNKKGIITAIDIDDNRKTIDIQIEENTINFNKSRIRKKLKEIRDAKKLINPEAILSNDEIKEIKLSIINDEETKQYKEQQKQILSVNKENYNIVRNSINELNELNEFSAEIERNNLQTIDNFLSLKELTDKSYKCTELFNKIKETRLNNINNYIEYYKNKNLTFNETPKQILKNMRKLYGITKDIDDIELYEMFELESNISMSNKLADICLSDITKDNIINQESNKNNPLQRLISKKIVNNKMLGILLLSSYGMERTSFISNNVVTTMKTMFVTSNEDDPKTNNKYIYNTRTLGELLYEITNPEYGVVDKAYKQQIYLTYDGTRPKSDEYYKWNGLQVYDIDLKEWVNNEHGDIDLLKQRLYEELSVFHWFLWIVKSASGNGIHIYTKVTPPHHIHINPKDNEYISKYWYYVNYIQKQSIVYDCLKQLNSNYESGITFNKQDFIESETDTENCELKFLDNVVARITAGIRLTFDETPLVNHNFIDLHISLGFCQTLNGWYSKVHLDKTLFRNTKTNNKLLERLNELTINDLNEYYEKENIQETIDLSKYVKLGLDIDNISVIPRQSINYIVRYNVVNTLAALFGKDGIPIAHTLLQSELCKNVNEINSFYSTALNNHKEPTKIGLDILKRYGIIKTVEAPLKEHTDNIFKNGIKTAIENTFENTKLTYDINLRDGEYLSDYVNDLDNRYEADKINLIASPPGSGKCFGFNTPILMYDCSVKMIQDIVVGDLVMGWDSTPREVTSTCTGIEKLYKITPSKGMEWICNESHIISCIESGEWNNSFGGKLPNFNIIQNLQIIDIMSLSVNHRKKLFRVPLNFNKQKTEINPYWLGLWLGDSNMNDCQIAVGDIDKSITVPFIEAYAKQLNCYVTRYQDFRDGHNVSTYNIVSNNWQNNPLKEKLKYYNLIGNKHIPKEYLYNDRKTRLFLFAGLIDSDGGGSDGTYDYVTKLDSLKDDIVFLCRSLGYYVNINRKEVKGKLYWRLTISGDFTDVPVRLGRKKFICKINKNAMMYGFKITPLSNDKYYGIVLKGPDKLFLLSDFTVVHNTEIIKHLAKTGRRIMLVEPFISVIKNKIETDNSMMDIFTPYYGATDIKKLEYGENAVTTFDKFSRSNFEKISKMFDLIVIDESHLLFNSSYRIEATSASVRKLKNLLYISSNDPFAAKIILMTGTPTGESYYFNENLNMINVSKKMLDKTMEFIICDDGLDCITALAYQAAKLIKDRYTIMIPTNKGDIYSEKIIGMIEFLLDGPVKYGYYKRSNVNQEICKMINNDNTVGDYQIIFCSNYLSVGVDINDKSKKFASMYLPGFTGSDIEQFNARIRKKGIRSLFFVQTQKANGEINDLLLEEPNLVLKLTQEDIDNFSDDKEIAASKQEFIASYDPVLHKIVTPGFSYLNGKIQFDLESYELTNFENKYLETMQHPVKVARELSKYGYNISVNTEYESLPISEQEELKKIGQESAKDERRRKHQLLIGTYIALINNNTYTNESGLEFTNVIDWIYHNLNDVIEDRDLVNELGEPEYVKVTFDMFATPLSCIVKSKEALEDMIKSARYLIDKYSVTRAIELINQYIDDNGILKQKYFKRAINLLKLVDASDANELSSPLISILEKMYDFIDKFESSPNYRISHNTYVATMEEWTHTYIDNLGIKVNTMYGYDKIRDSLIEMLTDIATRNTSKAGIRYSYNKLPDANSTNIINKSSIDGIIEKMFKITSDIIENNRTKKSRERHIILAKQSF